MPLVSTIGSAIDYEVAGEGPPILLIRGLARSRRYWLGFDRLLQRSFTVITFDNRGMGRSGKAPGLWSISDMADDAADVLRDAGFEQAHVFGVSLGGATAQHLALKYPQRVDHLILGCTTPGLPEGIRPSLLSMATLAITTAAPRPIANAVTARLTLSTKHRRKRRDTIKAWRDIQRTEAVPRTTVAKQLLAMTRHRTGPWLGQVKSPTLVMTGDRDQLIDPRNSAILADLIPAAQLVTIPEAGHDLTTEQPERVARELERFCLGEQE